MLPDINLLPKQERESSVLYYVFLALLLVWLLFILFTIYQYISTKSKLFVTEETIRSLTIEQANLKQTLAEQPVKSVDNLANSVAFVENNIIETSPFIEHLTKMLPDKAKIVRYTYAQGSTTLDTEYPNAKGVSAYVTALTDSEYLEDVKIDRMSVAGELYSASHSLEVNVSTLKGGE